LSNKPSSSPKYKSLQDRVWKNSEVCRIIFGRNRIEQDAEADLLVVMLIADVWFMVKLKVFGGAKRHDRWCRRLRSTVITT
jgi:hypothetical protein